MLGLYPTPPGGLPLHAEEPPRLHVQCKHLHCLEVWKWPEQVERVRLREPADDLGLTQESLATSIHRDDVTWSRLRQQLHAAAKTIRQPPDRNQERSPPRPPAIVDLAGRSQVLAPVDHIVSHQLAKLRFWHDQRHPSQLFSIYQHADQQPILV